MMDFLNGLDLHKIALHPYRTVAGQKHVKAGMPAPGVRAMEKADIESIRKQLTDGGFTLVDRPGVQGKDKCRYLKAIRKKILAENNFTFPLPIVRWRSPVWVPALCANTSWKRSVRRCRREKEIYRHEPQKFL